MKIAVFTESYPPTVDGVSHLTAKLVEELSREHEVAVFTLDDREYVERNGATIYRFKGTKLRSYPQYRYRIIPPFRRVCRIVREFSPDIIHSQTPFTMGACGENAARKLNIPLVTTFHTDLIDFLLEIVREGNLKSGIPAKAILSSGLGKKFVTKLINLLSYPAFYSYFVYSDAVTAPSDAVVDILLKNGVEREKLFKIPNFIETNPEGISGDNFREKWGIDGFMVLHVGRLSWEKRIHKILETAAHVEDATFVITSHGPLSDDLRKKAREMKLDNVTFTGFLPYRELYGAYDACDVFLSSAPYETFNVSAAQTLAFGKPIIGMNRMGMKEFIKHGYNGFLVEWDSDEVKNYARYIKLLMEDEKLKRLMGRRSLRISKEFDRRKIVRKFVEVYERAETNGYKMRRYVYALSLFFTLLRATRV